MSLEFTAHYDEGDLIAGRFEIVRLIGGGATGSVYLAHDRQLDGAEVVLKILHPHLHFDRKVLARLQNEPTVSRKICSPYLVQVFELHTLEDGRQLITMEYLRGASLRALIDAAPHGIPQPEVIRLLRGITRGLQSMHQAAYLHRDLKPENIIVTEAGEVKLVDFGLACPLAELAESSDLCIGTPYYTSPELVRGEKLDSRSDLYALGILAFELCTGTRPFTGKSEAELLEKHIRAELPELPRGIDDRLASLIGSLCAKQPRRRPADTEAVLGLLESCEAAQLRLLRRSVISNRIGLRLQRLTITLLMCAGLIAALRQNRDSALFASLPLLYLEKVTGADLSPAIHFIGADLNYSVQSFTNVLARGDGNGLRILTALGMDPNTPVPALRRQGSDLPIFWLVWRGTQFVNDYINAGGRTDVRTPDGMTPLMFAARAGRGEMIHVLSSRDILELRDNEGYTALCYAYAANSDYSVLSLLKYGAKPDVVLPDGTPCAHLYLRKLAKGRFSPEVFASLLAAGFPFDLADERTGESGIHLLAQLDFGPILDRALQLHADPERRDKAGYTAVFHAARAGNVQTLRVLAAHSASLDLTDNNGIPFEFHVLDGYRRGAFELGLVRSLLAQGMPVNRTLPHSTTRLADLAAREGMTDLYHLLRELGAAPSEEYREGETQSPAETDEP